MLTDTEIQTLAIMLDSGTRHMTTARDTEGRYVWTGNPLHEGIAEAIGGFYDIQILAKRDRLVILGA